ncbi:SDR family oxidoreductase [Planococcus sp. S3-L1]|uniref:SDR family NAD(P)-dependent oxidoreductase n=1 Tax=Planococcus sp. S3-L1 TaxID=3046200 RepID=UPI0024BB8E61|nr:SDR family oxidoreductase [Planococcus sp. S3-L1]MDJ0332983.1 SDR family oxidoreductase [Planococcus sp. S3-L1]
MNKKVVIITGSASGIGKGIAEKFASKGNDIFLIDINDKVLLETKIELSTNYPEVSILSLAGDLTSPAFIEEVTSTCRKSFETINILINCAGVFPSTPALEITRDEWNKVFSLNVSALFFLTQSIVKLMIETGARDANVVNITSAASEVARPGVVHYCSSKAAVKMLTQGLALELASKNIRVNAVGPGLVETETLMKTLNTEKAIAEHREKVSYSPLNRTAKMQEISSVVEFISSPDSSYITGQNILVDGGYSAGRVFKNF